MRPVIVPAATYAFPLAYLTPTDLGKIDKVYAKICKQALEMLIATPTSMILEDKQKGGARMTSLIKGLCKACCRVTGAKLT